MRVIAGERRGKRLISPKDSSVRPTSDKVKGSIFNMLAQDIDQDTIVFDLFSGSGALGIEAISRGAKKTYFSDSNKTNAELTKRNLEICNFQDKSVMMHADYKSALHRIPEKADIIFADPPYALCLWKEIMESIIKQDKLNNDGLLIIEHDTRDVLQNFPEEFVFVKEKNYGATSVTIFKRKAEV